MYLGFRPVLKPLYLFMFHFSVHKSIPQMENYLSTQYVSDLRELIFLKQHELARQQVVKERKESIIKECDPIVSKIKEYDNKDQLSEQEAKEREELQEKLVEKWKFKLYYQDELKDNETELVRFQMEFDALRAQLAHIELCHPDMAE